MGSEPAKTNAQVPRPSTPATTASSIPPFRIDCAPKNTARMLEDTLTTGQPSPAFRAVSCKPGAVKDRSKPNRASCTRLGSISARSIASRMASTGSVFRTDDSTKTSEDIVHHEEVQRALGLRGRRKYYRCEFYPLPGLPAMRIWSGKVSNSQEAANPRRPVRRIPLQRPVSFKLTDAGCMRHVDSKRLIQRPSRGRLVAACSAGKGADQERRRGLDACSLDSPGFERLFATIAGALQPSSMDRQEDGVPLT